MLNKFEKNYEVTYRDTDARGECFFTSYMNFMADCGLSQEEKLGFSLPEMVKNNHTWMLYDYDVIVYKYVKYKEKVRVITYAKSLNKFYALRVFEMYNEDNELISEGSTLALLIDTIKKRPCRIPNEYYKAYGVEKENCGQGKRDLEVKNIQRLDYEKKVEVRYTDIDMNWHVGNVKYIEWVLETIPLYIIKNYRTHQIKIKYKKEVVYGTNVSIQTQINCINEESNEISTIHKLVNDQYEELALIETYWNKANL
ncbi:acyl-[acyl-carrier-protein] thioesterase [Romboutsia sp. 1001713B170207_170306_H8]|uniref:acyl-[acyl-carrier-protein] thioesterase n=1 Tax=Romboutsia sp. 1001713B170207_170306_H8 TaxID=2787112 RepID=UPI0018971C17|nr:acyl-ACP thioesterase domain-containing protein [Romboutsia sp. 1001713B170207_170306_H8]